MQKLYILFFGALFTVGVCGFALAGQIGLVPDKDGNIPVEFTTEQDKQALPPGVNGLDSYQVIFTKPIDGPGLPFPRNTFDYDGVDEYFPVEQVDALANTADAYFHKLISNHATLLVSFRRNGPLDEAPQNAVYLETNTGIRRLKWTQTDLDADGPGTVMENLDGIELWGPGNSDDAYLFSKENDLANGAVSVWSHNPAAPVPGGNPYLQQPLILAAIQALGYIGPDDVDLDAMMVWDAHAAMGDFDGVFGDDDEILFSIRANGNFDGGEIIYLKGTQIVPGTNPVWLNHGNHDWDTPWDVIGGFQLDPQYPDEEVDAIEAVPGPSIPSMTSYGLIILVALILLSGLYVMYRRRAAARA